MAKKEKKKKREKGATQWVKIKGSHAYLAINGGWLVSVDEGGLTFISDAEHITPPEPVVFGEALDLPPEGQGWGDLE